MQASHRFSPISLCKTSALAAITEIGVFSSCPASEIKRFCFSNASCTGRVIFPTSTTEKMHSTPAAAAPTAMDISSRRRALAKPWLLSKKTNSQPSGCCSFIKYWLPMRPNSRPLSSACEAVARISSSVYRFVRSPNHWVTSPCSSTRTVTKLDSSNAEKSSLGARPAGSSSSGVVCCLCCGGRMPSV